MTVDEKETVEMRLDAFLRPHLEALPDGRGNGVGRTGRNVEANVRGLLSDLGRKSVEPIALASGIEELALQPFLLSRPWDHEGLRDQVHQTAARTLPALLDLAVIDETAHVMKGDKTPGVQRQWCGTRGKVEN